MKLYKRYLRVNVEFDEDGNTTPKSLIWDDGIEYEIDKVLEHATQLWSEVGGSGEMFLCRINGYERKLFREFYARNGGCFRWFIESHKP